MQTLYNKTDIQDVIMHHGVKGMKWGVTRARNKVGMAIAKSSRQQVANATETYKNARDIEKDAGRIAGRGNSTARMAAGKWASERANRERNNADRDSSAGAFNGNRHLSNIAARNQNKLAKLEAKAKKSGKPKDKQNAEAFRAYANEVEKRSKGIRKGINDNYAESQQARSESFKARDEYLKAIEKYVYGNTTVQRPNINKVNDDNYQSYRKQVNEVKQEFKKQQSQAKQQSKAKHSDLMDDVLLHYGTKGMKWGVRRAAKNAEKGISKLESASQTYKKNPDTIDAIRKELSSRKAQKQGDKAEKGLSKLKKRADKGDKLAKAAYNELTSRKKKSEDSVKDTMANENIKKQYGIKDPNEVAAVRKREEAFTKESNKMWDSGSMEKRMNDALKKGIDPESQDFLDYVNKPVIDLAKKHQVGEYYKK